MAATRQIRESPGAGAYGGPIAPLILSILGVVAWLVFILIFAPCWSSGFSLFQNVIVTIVSFLIAGPLIGLMWMPWFRLTGERR